MPQGVPDAAGTSIGHAVPTPSQVSCTSHKPAALRHTVPEGAGPEATHVERPELQSIWPTSQAPATLQEAPAMQPVMHTPVELQLPPAHIVLAGAMLSVGQSRLVPSHTSGMSHSPRARRHDVPATAGPVATQTGDGPPQVHVPTSQGLAVRHSPPSVQSGTQVPEPLHRPPGQTVPEGAKMSAGQAAVVPSHLSPRSHGPAATRHTAPGAAGPMARHVGTPPTHSVRPSSQAPVVQRSPGTHMVHIPPPSHARPSRQRVPAGRSVVPRQVPEAPTGQSMVPDVHGLPVAHAEPSMHSLHVPVTLHCPTVPQVEPAGTVPESVHTGEPEPQLVAPVVHGLPVLQMAPSMHTSQEPVALHARPSAHLVPGGRPAAEMHSVTPGVGQSTVPDVQGSPVAHTDPSMHSLHMPPGLQVPDAPHGAPGGRSSLAKQNESPVGLHVTTPLVHGLPVGHSAPSTQMEHAPIPSHPSPSPQDVPAGA